MNTRINTIILGFALASWFAALATGQAFDSSSVFRVNAESGHGSGFLVDSERNLIVTNYHVVKLGADVSKHISVAKHNGRRFHAVVVASSARRDLAVLQVPPEAVANARAVTIPTDDESEVLDEVVAYGSPLSLGMQQTVGHISYLGKNAGTGDFLIQPGNSGGPIVNRETGKLVGVSTFGVGNSAGFIRIDSVKEILAEIQTLQVIPVATPLPEPEFEGSYPAELLEERILLAYDNRKSRGNCEAGDFGRHAFGWKQQWCNEVNNDKFSIQVYSPTSAFYEQISHGLLRDENRQRRRTKNLDENYRRSINFYDWYNEALRESQMLAPVVTIFARPQVGETGGSIGKQIAAGIATGAIGAATGIYTPVQTRRNFKYKGEFHSIRVLVDEVEIQPVRRMRQLTEMHVETYLEMRDEAFMGIYQYDLAHFADGENIIIEVYDARNPTRPTGRRYKLDRKDRIMKQIIEDYEALKRFKGQM